MKAFDEVINERRSIRKYLDKDVSNEDINKIIESGILAPSAHNRQPWKIKVVKDKEKDLIAKTLSKKLNSDNSISNTATIIEESPVLLIAFYDKEENVSRDNDMLSLGAFIENMTLKATDLGLGSLWIANTNHIKEEIKEITRVNLECISTLAIGYKNQNPNPRPRKATEEIIIK